MYKKFGSIKLCTCRGRSFPRITHYQCTADALAQSTKWGALGNISAGSWVRENHALLGA